jgi:hypothetical protein
MNQHCAQYMYSIYHMNDGNLFIWKTLYIRKKLKRSRLEIVQKSKVYIFGSK